MSRTEVIQTFTAEGQYTTWISSTHKNEDNMLDVSFAVSSDWVGMVCLEKTNDDGVTARTVDWVTQDIEFAVRDNSEGVKYRLYCCYYESGQAEGRIYK